METADIRNVVKKLKSSLPICRICLEISMEYIEFEGPLCMVDGEEITYSDGFKEITSPGLELPDESPTNFCVTCGSDLLNAYLFLKRVENANQILAMVKCFTEDSQKSEEKQENDYYSDGGPNSPTEDLKGEVLSSPPQRETHFTDIEHNVKRLKIPDAIAIKMEAREEFDVESENAKDDSTEENEIVSSLIIDTGFDFRDGHEADNSNTAIGDPVPMWTCEDCGHVYETNDALSDHRKKHKLLDGSMNACFHCSRSFCKSEELDSHLLFHEYSKSLVDYNDKMAFRCILCEKICRTEADFIDHMNVHTGRKPYECNSCSNRFQTKRNLQLHIWRVHTNRDLKRRKGKECEKCTHCERVVRKTHMEKHMEAHNPTKDFTCSVCEKRFATKLGLKAHSVAHKQRKFVCNSCDKVCLTEFTLRKHIQYIHLSDRKKYQCEDCGLFFQYPSYLKDHQRKHNLKNRFQCPHCDRSYWRKPQLDIHMRYHTNDFRYKCEQCDKCYVTKSNLTDHVRSAHTKITYDCDKCDQKFKSGTGLRKHKYTHTGYPYICPLCSVGQTSRSGMKTHLFGVHKDSVTEDEFNEMFPIIIPKTGYRRPRVE